MGWSDADLAFMHSALDEARAAGGAGEVPVGAVVVFDGQVIGSGHNRTISDHDPSGHAEIAALRAAAASQKNHRLNGATLYVTLEPCAMCVGALSEARVSRVVFGAYDPKAGAAGSAVDLVDSAALNHRFEINGGVLADESGELLRAFFEARR